MGAFSGVIDDPQKHVVMARDPCIYAASAVRLRERREAIGLSVPQVAQRLGVDVARYRSWEKLFGPLPQRQYGEALARVLNVEAGWFYSGEGEIPPPPTALDFELLAQRAVARRSLLRLTRTEVAQAMGVTIKTLSTWEESLPSTTREEKELLWENVLRVPRGWLRNRDMDAPAPSSSVTDPAINSDNVAGEILAVGAWLARASERSRSVRFEDLSDAEQRRATMFADRFGVSGSENAILQVIGNRFGLTRERVRQVVDVMASRAGGVSFVLPRLLELREAATAAAETSVVEFEAANRLLLGPSLSLLDVDGFARAILGFSVAKMTERSHWQAGNALQPMLAGNGGTGIAVAVRDTSRKMIRSCGAANVMFVTGMVSTELDAAVSVRDVRHALSAVEGMEWLTEDEGWYWFGMDTANNRVMEIARKVLSVAGCRIDIEDLQQAVCRSRRILYEDRTIPPAVEVPKHVLREIFVRVPWLSVIQHDDFVLTETVPVEESLNDSELAVAKTIRKHGGAVARQTLNKEFVLPGIFSVPNLQIILSNSPIIRPLGFGIYGLRGVAVSERAFSNAMSDVGHSSGLPSILDADGWHEFELSVTEFKLHRGLVDFPSRVVKAIPAGEYLAEGFLTGVFIVGGVPSAPNRVTKLVTLLRKAGVRSSDVLRVRIHPEMFRAEFSKRGNEFATTGITDPP